MARITPKIVIWKIPDSEIALQRPANEAGEETGDWPVSGVVVTRPKSTCQGPPAQSTRPLLLGLGVLFFDLGLA